MIFHYNNSIKRVIHYPRQLRCRALKRRVPGELIRIFSSEIFVIFKTWILKLRIIKRQKQLFKDDPVFCDVIFCCKSLNLKFLQDNLIYFM